jgi:hypothetical protein
VEGEAKMTETIQRTKSDIDSSERMRKFEAEVCEAAKIRGLTLMEYLQVLSELQTREIQRCRKEELK